MNIRILSGLTEPNRNGAVSRRFARTAGAPTGFRFGAIRRGLLVATAFAATGVVVLIWVSLSQFGIGVGSNATHNHARIDAQEIPARLDSIFVDGHVPLDSDDAAREALATLRESARRRIHGLDSVRQIGAEDRTALAEAAVALVAPYLTWDVEQYLQTISSLGGEPPSDDSMNRLVSYWQFSRDRAKVESISPQSVEFRIVTNTMNEASIREDLEYMLKLGMVNPQIHPTRNSDRFPAVFDAQSADGPVIELRVPAVLKLRNGQKRAAFFGVTLARHPETGGWQPVEVRLYHETGSIATSHEEAMRQANIEPGNLPM